MDSSGERNQQKTPKKKLWNSDIARAVTQVAKAKKIHGMEEFGEMRIIHPMRL